MKDEDLEVLITLDDPGEDTLEEDTFNEDQDRTSSGRRIAEGGDDE